MPSAQATATSFDPETRGEVAVLEFVWPEGVHWDDDKGELRLVSGSSKALAAFHSTAESMSRAMEVRITGTNSVAKPPFLKRLTGVLALAGWTSWVLDWQTFPPEYPQAEYAKGRAY